MFAVIFGTEIQWLPKVFVGSIILQRRNVLSVFTFHFHFYNYMKMLLNQTKFNVLGHN